MKHTIIYYLRMITILLLTIVVNQNGELVPDRTTVIQKLTDALDDFNKIDGGIN